MASPFWSFLIALRAVIWLFKNHETQFTSPYGIGVAAWLAGYAFAWRYDILKMYELYAALPTQPPPDCYIATAATHGHPRFVHSWVVENENGDSIYVNAQLQRLKCAELALMTTAPHFHKPLRKIYDVVGKRLARKIQHPFFADIAYLFLKPFEWMAMIVLRAIVPEINLFLNSVCTDFRSRIKD